MAHCQLVRRFDYSPVFVCRTVKMSVMSFFCICEESRIRSGVLYVFARYCRRTYNNKGLKLQWTLTLCAGVGYRRANLRAILVDAP